MRVYADPTATGPQLDAELWAEGPIAHSVWAHVEGRGPRPVLVNIRTAGKFYVEPTEVSGYVKPAARRRIEELQLIQQRANTARIDEQRRVDSCRTLEADAHVRARWARIPALPSHRQVKVRVSWNAAPRERLPYTPSNRTSLWEYGADRARPARLSAKRWRELAV